MWETMQPNEDFIIDLVDKQKDCEFSLRFLLEKENGSWKNFFSMLKLVKRGTRKEINYDYGKYILREIILNIAKGRKLISSLYPTNTQKGKLIIPNYGEYQIESVSSSEFVGSKYKYGLLKEPQPIRFCSFNISQNQRGQYQRQELLNEKNPYFPNLKEAVISFFELAVEDFNDFGSVYVVVPEYRTKIEKLKLIFSKAELSIVSPEIKYEDLIVKIFAKSGTKITTLPDIQPKNKTIELDIGFYPDTLSVALFSSKDKMKIDSKEFNKWSTEEEGVYIERPEEEIFYLTKAGESQNLEYKFDILDDLKRNDFIESIVAFLNTNKGIILIGVDDNGDIVGSRKTTNDIEKMVHDCCEPPPKGIKIGGMKIGGEIIIVVEVPEGDNKPYQSKADKNFYVRHSANDMRMERSELDKIMEERIAKRRQGLTYS
jgi:hypothetical protein